MCRQEGTAGATLIPPPHPSHPPPCLGYRREVEQGNSLSERENREREGYGGGGGVVLQVNNRRAKYKKVMQHKQRNILDTIRIEKKNFLGVS